jgi:tetratricopeptide (TPR) repeat protein
MRILSTALAVSFGFGLMSVAAAQSTPTPGPRSGPPVIGTPGPGPGDVLPAPLPAPEPGTPPAPGAPGAPPAAGPGAAPGQTAAAPQVPLTRDQQLEALFAALKVAPNQQAADNVERRISAIWQKSGSDTVDLLTKWADNAIEAKDYPLALDYLDRIIALKPDFVEGWDKRANTYFLMGNYGRALADIEKVLALEPRHFGALAGLGTIMRSLGEDRKALIAYQRALEIDPHLDTVKNAVQQLRDLDVSL